MSWTECICSTGSSAYICNETLRIAFLYMLLFPSKHGVLLLMSYERAREIFRFVDILIILSRQKILPKASPVYFK